MGEAETDEETAAGAGDVPGRRRRRLGTKQVAAVVLLLLVGEIAYVVRLTDSSSSAPPQKVALPPLSTLAPPSTTVPTTVPAVTVPTAPAVVAPKTAVAMTHPVTTASATAAQPSYCTAGDLVFTTVTTAGSYSPGETVDMTMEVTDVTACIFQPEPVGAYDCPSTLAVVEAGSQVFPNSEYTEACDPPPEQTMNAGSKEAVSASWTIPSDMPDGSYEAIAEWGWSAGPGQSAHTVDIGSRPFTIT